MSLTSFYFEPFYSLAEFDGLFDDAFNARSARSHGNGQQLQRHAQPGNNAALHFKPRMDLHESSDKNIMTATFELPGLKKEDVQIDVHNNRLTVSGERGVSEERNEDGYAIRERRFGKFSRTLPLPIGTKTEEIKAEMENGVLTVTFPKSAPEQAPQRITVA